MQTRLWILMAVLVGMALAVPASGQMMGPADQSGPMGHMSGGMMGGGMMGGMMGQGMGPGMREGRGSRMPSHEGPLISIMLEHRQELGLSAAQGQELERIRTDFQRKAIQLDADQRVAQTDLSALLRSDSVDLDKVESKVREIERLRADLRIGRIRAIEQGKGQLTPAQRAKLQTLLAEPRWPWPGAGGRPAPPPRRF